MELRHIRYFIALANELNFSRAAEKLHISQPPLSRQIKELEDEIGAKLFHRTKREVTLTKAGKSFLQDAYQIMDSIEQASINAQLLNVGLEGELRIGFTGAVQDLVPSLLAFRKIRPDISVKLLNLSTEKQIDALNNNVLDIGFISRSEDFNKIEVRPVRKFTFFVALPEKHPLASAETVSLRSLKDETFVMTQKSIGLLYYNSIMDIFKKVGFTPKISYQTNDLQTVLALVSAGVGITITPSPFYQIKGIIKKEISDINLTITASLAWKKENYSDITKEFLLFFFDFHKNELEIGHKPGF